jgi:glycosyl transferase family 87
MRALVRMAAISLAGAVLYYAGLVNSIVIYRPSPVGAALVVSAIALALAMLVVALVGDGRGDARTAPSGSVGALRAGWLVISVMALVGASWLLVAPRQHAGDWTPYHNDAIALNECAARLYLEGRDPYQELDVFTCYARLGIGADRTTPLRRGLFARDGFYPTDDELDAVWAIRSHESAAGVEFESRPSYPALSFVLIAPAVALGIDTNFVYVACLLAAMALVLVRAPASLRPFVATGLLGAACLSAFTVGGSADLLYALPLVAAWLWRERRWSGLAFGVAAATKQLAWFFGPFYLLAILATQGRRVALRRGAEALAVFAIANLPFILDDPGAWLAGVFAPVLDPMFPRGAGLIFLVTNRLLAEWPPVAYTAIEVAGYGACLVVAWRARRTSPELGAVLAMVPLFLAYRSLFSYFFLLPLFAFSGLVRLPLGDLDPVLARAAGAVTLFALPRRLERRPEPDPVAVPVGASAAD